MIKKNLTLIIFSAILINPFIILTKQNITINQNSAYAEQVATAAKTVNPKKKSNQLFQATGVILIIWLGIAGLLFKIERNVKKLEKEIEE